MTMQKIGYEGTYLMELANTERPRRRSSRKRGARGSGSSGRWHIHDWLISRTSRSTTDSPSRSKGWLHNRRSSGKIHFLTLRDGTGFIQCVMSKQAVGEEAFKQADHLSQESAIIVDGTVRADTRAPGGYEIDVTGLEVVSESNGLSDHAEGAWRRLPDGSTPPVDSLASGSRRSCACATR